MTENLSRLQNVLDHSGILEAIISVCRDKTECYLVGGAIRDCLLGRELNDFDFAFPEDPTDHAREIAEKLGATWFVLDAERGHSRFVLKRNDGRIYCDFAPFRAPSLESDLHKRDFTINAMAVALLDQFQLIDPMQGQEDLARGILRACNDYSFQDDPLRCLKAIRHVIGIDLDFESSTLRNLGEAAPQVDQVAAERLRSELAKTISNKQSARAFEILDQTGLLRELFGRGKSDSLKSALFAVDRMEEIFQALQTGSCGQTVKSFLREQCEEDMTMSTALKLAAFLYEYRPIALKSVLQALRFSNRTIALIEQTQAITPDMIGGLEQVAANNRSRARWLFESGKEPLVTALFIALLSPETPPANLLQAEILIDSYAGSISKGRLRELVDGQWLREHLNIEEGPKIGHVMNLLHLAEIRGEATTPDKAREWILANQKLIDKDFEENL